MNNYNTYSKIKNNEPVWNPVTQKLVYDSIVRRIDFTDQTILDLGCGKGNLIDYLVANSITPHYHVGVDIIDPFLDIFINKNHYGGCNYTIIKDDFMRTGFFNDYDKRLIECDYSLVLASLEIMETPSKGKHLIRVSDLMKNMWDYSRKGFVIATQSCWAEDQSDGSWYANPLTLLEIIRQKLTTNVYIDHTYAPHFFTLIALKGKTEWEQLGGKDKSALKEKRKGNR